MNFKENAILALTGLKANKMRAFLTMLGIIIGISSVIMITTLGSILEKGLSGVVSDLGVSNLIQIGISYKEDSMRDEILDSDLITESMLESLRNRFGDSIKYISYDEGVGGGTIRHNREDIQLTVYGYTPDELNIWGTELVTGRYINEKDILGAKSVCVIPDELAEKLYGSSSEAIGQVMNVTLRNEIYEYSVVGVYKYKQSMFGGVFSANYDVHTPITTAYKITGGTPLYSYAMIIGSDDADVISLAGQIKDFLDSTYYKNNDTFEIRTYTMAEDLATINQYVLIIQGVLSLIAGISLLVGGIGVMNIMLVSVTERTKEIGVRKALGAPNSAIRAQFIVESVIICSIGGIIGIILGIALGNLGGMIFEMSAVPSVAAIIIAVSFSMAIGVFFGYYPANRAAKLDPIEALRYE